MLLCVWRLHLQFWCLYSRHYHPEVLTAIRDRLVEEFMGVHTAEDWKSITKEFFEQWNLPNCCEAVDGKHVVMKVPLNSGSQLYFVQLQESFLHCSLGSCGRPLVIQDS